MTTVARLVTEMAADLSGLRAGVREAVTLYGGLARASEQTASRMERSSSAMVNGLRAIGIGFGLREVIGYADAWTNTGKALTTVSKSYAEVARTQEQLFQLSQGTFSSLTSTTKLYQSLALNARELGYDQGQLIRITKAVNQSLASGQASATTAAAAIQQLGQSFAAGVVNGDEFRSIMENAPVLINAVTRELGINRATLRDWSQQGLLSAQIVGDALLAQADNIEKAFKNMPVTIGQGFQLVQNSLAKFIGQTADGGAAAATLAKSLQFISQNFESIANSALVVGIAYSARWAAPYIAGATAFIAKQRQVSQAILSGNAVVLGSKQAFAQRAQFQAAEADAATQAARKQAANIVAVEQASNRAAAAAEARTAKALQNAKLEQLEARKTLDALRKQEAQQIAFNKSIYGAPTRGQAPGANPTQDRIQAALLVAERNYQAAVTKSTSLALNRAAANRVVTASTASLTAATVVLTAAERSAAVTSATLAATNVAVAGSMTLVRTATLAAGAAMTFLKGAMSFFGGGIGLAIIAIGYTISKIVGHLNNAANKAREFAAAQDAVTKSTNEANRALAAGLAGIEARTRAAQQLIDAYQKGGKSAYDAAIQQQQAYDLAEQTFSTAVGSMTKEQAKLVQPVKAIADISKLSVQELTARLQQERTNLAIVAGAAARAATDVTGAVSASVGKAAKSGAKDAKSAADELAGGAKAAVITLRDAMGMGGEIGRIANELFSRASVSVQKSAEASALGAGTAMRASAKEARDYIADLVAQSSLVLDTYRSMEQEPLRIRPAGDAFKNLGGDTTAIFDKILAAYDALEDKSSTAGKALRAELYKLEQTPVLLKIDVLPAENIKDIFLKSFTETPIPPLPPLDFSGSVTAADKTMREILRVFDQFERAEESVDRIAYAFEQFGGKVGAAASGVRDVIFAVKDLTKAIGSGDSGFKQFAALFSGGVGVFATVGNLLGTLMGESPYERELKDTLRKNSDEIARNSDELRGFRVAANTVLSARSALTAIVDPRVVAKINVAGATPFGTGGFDAQMKVLGPILTQFGLTFAQFNEIAKTNGIQILDSKGRIVGSALQQLADQLGFTSEALTRFAKDPTGRRSMSDLLAEVFDVDTKDASATIAREVGLLVGAGSPLAAIFQGLNTTTQEGRDAFEAALRGLVTSLDPNNPNGLALGDLGDLELDDLIKFITNTDKALDSFTETTNAATAAMRNVPTGYKIAQRIFESTAGGLAPGRTKPTTVPVLALPPSFLNRALGGSSATSTGSTASLGQTPPAVVSPTLTIAPGAIVVNGTDKNPQQVAQEVLGAFKDAAQRQSGNSTLWPNIQTVI